jgi:hypothetical protein
MDLQTLDFENHLLLFRNVEDTLTDHDPDVSKVSEKNCGKLSVKNFDENF